MTTNQHWTVGSIAERAGVPRHRVEYLINAKGINPIGTAGHYRVFDAVDAEALIDQLNPAHDAGGGTD